MTRALNLESMPCCDLTAALHAYRRYSRPGPGTVQVQAHSPDGDDLEEATYAQMIRLDEEIIAGDNQHSASSTSSRSMRRTSRRSSGCYRSRRRSTLRFGASHPIRRHFDPCILSEGGYHISRRLQPRIATGGRNSSTVSRWPRPAAGRGRVLEHASQVSPSSTSTTAKRALRRTRSSCIRSCVLPASPAEAETSCRVGRPPLQPRDRGPGGEPVARLKTSRVGGGAALSEGDVSLSTDWSINSWGISLWKGRRGFRDGVGVALVCARRPRSSGATPGRGVACSLRSVGSAQQEPRRGANTGDPH